MTKLVMDDVLRKRLRNLDEEVEVCDESGATVGRFIPEEMFRRLVIEWAFAQTTPEELQQRLNEPGGSSLSEIWKDLGQP